MFITFEGIEGSSKTTQAILLSKWLDKQSIAHLLTKEPGTISSKECREIRKLLLDPDSDLASRAELFLYLADRAQHVEKVITPAILERGLWVISDRYSLSTYAYQGCGRGHLYLGQSDWFRQALNVACYDLSPTITFVMDLPVEIGLSRAKSSNTEFEGGDRMERETIEFHKRLREGFLERAEELQSSRLTKCVVLNAEKTIEELHEDVKQVLREYVDEHKITIDPVEEYQGIGEI